MKQCLANPMPSVIKKHYKFDYKLGLLPLLFIFFGISQTIAQSFTDNFESEMTGATTFSEGGVNFTTNGSINIGFFANAGFGGAAGPPANDSRFLEALNATGTVGEIMISTPNRVFQLEMMAIWLSTIPTGDQSQAGTITFNGTPATGGAVIPVTFNINPPNTNSWEVVDFDGTALGGVNLSKVEVTLGPGVQYMAIDNFKFTHLDASAISLTIDNVSAVESNSGTQNFVFTITRSNNSSSFSVDVASADGTASSATDYTALAATTLNFTSGGPLTQTVTVPVLGDVDPESDETFFVNLTNATNGVEIIDAQGIGTILDDDRNCETFEDETEDATTFTQNGISFSTTDQLAIGFFAPGGAGAGQSDLYLESNIDNDPHTGSVGQIQLTTPNKVFEMLTVDLWLSTDGDPDTPEDGSVDFIGTLASGGTATATLTTTGSGSTWVQGISFSGTPLDGALLSALEVVLPAGVHYIAIDNFKFATFDETAVLVSIDDVCLNEGNSGNTIFTFNVSRSDVTTAFDVTVGSSPGTATPGTDYLPLAPVTLNFAANGPASQTVEVQVIGDLMSELPETFFMNLSNATNGAIISDGQGEGIIKDDDTICETFEDEATAGLTMFSEPGVDFSTTGDLVTAFFAPGGGGGAGSDYYLESPGFMNSGSVGSITVTTPNTAINLLRLDLWLSNDDDPDTQEAGMVQLVATLASGGMLMTTLSTISGIAYTENIPVTDFTGNDIVAIEVILLGTSNYVSLDNICFEVIDLAPTICPTVGAISASETNVCPDASFNLTATGLIDMDLTSNMDQDFGIEFVAFTSTPADPYSGGTSLGSVPFGSLTGGNTTASLVGVSFANSGSYEVYAILSPPPTDATCRPTAMTTITVNAPPTATMTIPAGEDEYCVDDATVLISLAGSPNGGVFSGPSVFDIGDGINFTFNPSQAGVGTHIITYTFTDANGCSASATDNIVVNDLPNVTFTALADLCLNAGVQNNLGGGSPSGGTYSGDGVTDDGNGMTYSFDPAVAGVGTHTLTYTYTDESGCTNSASDEVEVIGLAVIMFTAPADICQEAGIQNSLGGGTPTGGTYSGPGVTDNGNGMTYSFDPATAGVGIHTLTYTFGSSGCNGSATDDIEVFAQPTVNLATVLGYCLDANIATAPITGGSPSGGVYSGPGVTDLGNGASYNFDPMVAGVGTHIIEYTVTDANGCVNTAMSNLEVFDCDFSIDDPCACLDNASVIDLDAGTGGEDGQFSEVVSISTATGTGLPAGQIWTITAQTGALDAFNIPAIGTQSAGVPITTDGSTILNFNAGIYEIPFVHVHEIGYSISIEGPFPMGSAANVTLSISNKCAYPNPVFDPVLNNLDLCIMDPAVTLGASESSGTVPDGVTFTIDGNPATVFNPMVVGGGDHTVVMTYDGGADGNGGISPDGGTTAAFPGCTQTVQRVVNVNPICCMLDVTCPTGPVALQSIQDIPSIGTTPEILSAFTAQGGLVNASCNPVVLTALDTDDGGTGCIGDARTITRTFTVTDPITGESEDCPIDYVIVDLTPPVVTCAEFSKTFSGCPDPIFPNTPNGSWIRVPATGTFPTAAGGIFIQTVDLNGCVNDNYSNIGDLEWTLVSSFEENRVPGCSVDILNEIGIRDGCENVAMTTIITRSTIQFGGPAPVITCPADLTVECGMSTDPADTGMATATSDCGSPTITFADVSTPGCGMTEVITRTWTATDGCGTMSVCDQIITVEDTTLPVVTCTEFSMTFTGCPDPIFPNTPNGSWIGVPATGTFLTAVGGSFIQTVDLNGCVTDICSNFEDLEWTLVSSSEENRIPGCSVDILNEIGIRDGCENEAMTTIFTRSTIQFGGPAPVITCPANLTVECGMSTDPADTGMATATSDCGSPTIAFTDSSVPGCGFTEVITRTWTATDGCGTMSVCDQIITVEDTTLPVVTCTEFSMTFTGCPDPIFPNTPNGSWISVPATGTFLTAVGGSFIQTVDLNGCVTDICSNLGDLEWTLVSSFEENRVPGCSVDILNEIGIRDGCENEAMTTIFTRSTIQFGGPAPVITCPANLTVECGMSTDPADTGMATATSDCGMPTISFTDVSVPGCGMTEVITRTWTATDGCGTMSVCDQIITVEDTTLPVVTCTEFSMTFNGCPDPIFPNTPSGNWIPVPATGIFPTAVGGSFIQTVDINGCVSDFCSNVGELEWTLVSSSEENRIPGCSVDILNEIGIRDACENEAMTTIITRSTIQFGGPAPVITCPADLTVECDNPTDPAATGIATATSDCGSPTISFADVSTPGCGITEVITRTWTATDGCGTTITCEQIITVVDMTPPVITCPANVTVGCDIDLTPMLITTTFPFENGVADVSIPPGVLISNLTIPFAYDGSASNLFGLTVNITSPSGVTAIWGFGISGCGSMLDFVADDTGVVSISCNNYQNGTPVNVYQSWLNANFGDLGGPIASLGTDNGIWTIEIIDTNNDPTTSFLGGGITVDYFIFPDDLGVASATDNCDTAPVVTYADVSTQTVSGCGQYNYQIDRTWTATDLCGNATDCVQVITVEDITPPLITCPADLTIECDEDPTPANTGMATGTDNCSTDAEVIITFNDTSTQTATGCGQYMYMITRTWTATDACGNATTCDQVITVEDTTVPVITCPADQVLVCNTDPIPTASTITDFIAIGGIASDNCAAINELTVSFVDSPPFQAQLNFCSADPADRTLIRTYTVTDACGNSSTCAQNFVYNQSILDPVITAVPADQTVDCAVNAFPQVHLFSVDTDCGLGQTVTVSEAMTNGTPGCSGSTIQYTYTSTDVCGRSVSHTQIYTLTNEGPEFICPVDICIIECPADTDMIQTQFDNYAELATVITSCSETDISIGNNFNPNGFINQNCMNPTVAVPGAVAYQIVAFTATDACGRNATCTAMVVIKDSDGPVMNSSVSFGLADCNDANLQQGYTDWATNQLNGLSATDECSNGTVNFSYTPLTPNVDCSSGLASTEVSFIASDACGNETILTTFYRIIDNGTEPVTATVSGNILTEDDEMIALVNVEAEGFSDHQMMTNEDGYYHFDLAMTQNYTINPSRNDDPLNGITTFDLILMGQHLLEINTLDSPYKMIAADVNESGHISSLDMIELRRLILHIDEQFSSEKSWTFVDADYVFPQPTNPFATTFPTVYNINNLTNSEIVNFIGVKLGDLNATANINLLEAGDTRSFDGSLDIKLEDQALKAGQAYELAFKASDFKDVAGFQFTLNFAADYLQLMDYQGSELTSMSENNFGFTKAQEGKITVSWNENKLVNLRDDATIFKIQFTALKEVRLSEILSINSSLTPNEAYQANLRKEVKLVFEQSNLDADRFVLFQNQPNPFKQETMIGFQLPEAADATLTIFDLSGRVIWTQTKAYETGIHQVMVTKDLLDNSGVYYYQLSTGKRTATKKMIVLE